MIDPDAFVYIRCLLSMLPVGLGVCVVALWRLAHGD